MIKDAQCLRTSLCLQAHIQPSSTPCKTPVTDEVATSRSHSRNPTRQTPFVDMRTQALPTAIHHGTHVFLQVTPYNLSRAGVPSYNGLSHDTNSKDNAPGKQRRPRRRRAFSELKRDISCPYDKCDRVYASKHALNLHVRIKHNCDNSDTISLDSSDSRDSGLYSPRSSLDVTPASTPQYISDPDTPSLALSDDDIANVHGFEDLLAAGMPLYDAFAGEQWNDALSCSAPMADGSLDSLQWHDVPIFSSAFLHRSAY